MPAISAYAPGKVILFGEHAVVYGRPAIAIPVSQARARAMVSANPRAKRGEVLILAPDIGLDARLDELPEDHPLSKVVHEVIASLGIGGCPACRIHIHSTIPLASGLGSSAAVSVALIRALSAFLGHPLPDERVSDIAFEIEKLHHDTPSGIDNTVVAFAKPVYFMRGAEIEILKVPQSFQVIIGDTGISSPTAIAVGEVRGARQENPEHYEAIFDEIGRIARGARQLIESGRPMEMGTLMDENHQQLQALEVSSAELDALVEAARAAGALGAKLSGGGRGGNMIALAPPEKTEQVRGALEEAGAARTMLTVVGGRGRQ